MKNSTISQNELLDKQAMIDMVLMDREHFRAQAESSLLRFSPRERKLLKKIETETVSAYDVLYAWKNELNPLIKQLESKRVDKTFRIDMKKQLILAEDELNEKVRQLVEARISEIQTRFLEKMYTSDRTAYRNAEMLLTKPDQELDELLSHVVSATLSTIVAAEHGVTIIDGHASLFRRLRLRRQVRRERKQIKSSHRERLAYITRRKQVLTNQNGGLLVAISEKGWDLITIISMRNQYEKRINALPLKSSKNVVKRLAIFEEITQKFRNDYIEKITSTNPKAGLNSVRTITQEVDDLLQRIFDLSTAQKNQLLVHSKEYRELTEEHQEILVENNKVHI
ncbi:MAG: hypothetical protein H6797_00350 [Candidatus Nomurabacteria bacterium]|nr:MAG: hypothetical protein H6797_00350 [Candidatus Nomurabacteria bacterium]